jgi:hypothetical protein
MVSRPEEFLGLCKNLATNIGLSVQNIKGIAEGCQILCVEPETKWRNARKMPVLVRILRSPEVIDEPAVRSFYEDMKSSNVTKGIFITASTFSRAALNFVENRPMELWNKDKLQTILQK